MTATAHPRRRARKPVGCPIVAVDKFIQATRDSGYKSTASAVAELIDNSIQAGADEIEVFIQRTDDDSRFPLEVYVCDNGEGMDSATLRQALRFGGSSRFNDRGGLGRYGMGLPNSSLSQAQRVTVYSWKDPSRVYSCFLDLLEIARGEMAEVPAPRRDRYPFEEENPHPSGTIVMWTGCDRLDQRRVSTLERKLAFAIGRQFRFFLWRGVQIFINGQPVQPVDPLFLNAASAVTGGRMFGSPIEYEVRAEQDTSCRRTGTVTVVFTELPVHDWHSLPNQEKRRLGIAKGAGVSVVRGGREVDHGWFFMGSKRRENYDDWWRCEVRFDPVLDEAFGITHTKQQIRPKAHLLEALAPDIEAAARALNTRARRAHFVMKAAAQLSDAEKTAAEKDPELKPLPARGTQRDREVLSLLRRHDPSLRTPASRGGTEYRVLVAKTAERAGPGPFFDHAYERGRVVLAINPDHPFYKRVIRPLEESEEPRDHRLKAQLELLLISLSREIARSNGDAKRVLTQLRSNWSDSLATLLNAR
jgi:hypothetical protein